MRVLVVGGGGREHALCWRLSQNPSLDRLYAAPGNAGIAQLATLVPISSGDVDGLVEFAERESIELTVVGPEAPLVAGLADEMQARALPVFGPTSEAARIEGSKAWARELCERHRIPAPRSGRFDDVGSSLEFIERLDPPYVVKADGLAGGKGVTIAENREQAREALENSLVRHVFGRAGDTVVVEEYVSGYEVTAMALVDGRNVLPLAFAHDYKRALEGDLGPNTGGMGAFSPVPTIGPEVEEAVVHGILRSVARALEEEGIRYRGVLYAGLMMTEQGPKVLEFNCRLGDPETQVIMPRLTSNLGEALLACVEGNLGVYRLSWTAEACVGVVLASAGYPGPAPTGQEITGLEEAEELEGVHVFHAGTADRDGRVVAAGGRVLTVAALGPNLAEARRLAYQASSLIQFDGMTYRRDIAGGVPEGAG
jgi:phosphoribosylamine---glycine ligase